MLNFINEKIFHLKILFSSFYLSFIFAASAKAVLSTKEQASLAQLVEQLTRNEQAVGSSPMGGSFLFP